MPSPKLVPLVLSDEEQRTLEGWARRRTSSRALAMPVRAAVPPAHRSPAHPALVPMATTPPSTRPTMPLPATTRPRSLTPAGVLTSELMGQMPIHENLICLCPRTAQEHLSVLFDHYLMALCTSDPELVSLDRRERIQKEFPDYRSTVDADDQVSPHIE